MVMRESCPCKARFGDPTAPAPSRSHPGRDCGSAVSGGRPSHARSNVGSHGARGSGCHGIDRHLQAWSPVSIHQPRSLYCGRPSLGRRCPHGSRVRSSRRFTELIYRRASVSQGTRESTVTVDPRIGLTDTATLEPGLAAAWCSAGPGVSAGRGVSAALGER